MQRTTAAIFTGAAFIYFAAHATEVAQPDAVTTALTRTNRTATGQVVEVPARPEVIVSLTTIPLHGATRVHKHPYQRFVYVLAGHLRVTDMTTGAHHDYKPGDFLAEMRGTYHFGANMGDGPNAGEVRLLVIDQVPPGTRTNVVMQTDEP